jgi:hypothetical protein
MMKLYITILMLFVNLSCGGDNDDGSFEIPNLQSNIKAFIDARKCFKKDIKAVLINLEVKNDSLSVSMADTYPDVKEVKYNYDTVLYGHRIIFTGERIKGYYKKSSTNQYPPDLVEISKSREWPFTEEFTAWLFLYKDGKLIYKDLGCAEIQ